MTKKIKREINSITTDLQNAMKREASNIIAIGKLLIEADEQLDYGEWMPWLENNFGSSISTAGNYMAAAKFAAKFPSVANLKLRPSALYLLGHDLDEDDLDDCLFDDKAVKAILKAAETKPISADQARDIAEALKPKPPLQPLLTAEERADQLAAEATQEDIDDILDGPPPELPPTQEATAADVNLPPFDQAVKTLMQLHTKPLAKFTCTMHSADDIREIAAFLEYVADKLDK